MLSRRKQQTHRGNKMLTTEDVDGVVLQLKRNPTNWFTADYLWEEHHSSLTMKSEVKDVLTVLLVTELVATHYDNGQHWYKWKQ